MTIAEFMAARLAEDTVEADRAYSETLPLHVFDCEWETFGCNCVGPARVRVELEAKRRIVELHGEKREDQCETCAGEAQSADGFAWTVGASLPCDTLRALAAPYADHPDFDEAWRL